VHDFTASVAMGDRRDKSAAAEARPVRPLQLTETSLANLAEKYRFTPAELRVLRALLEEAGGVRAVAQTLGVSSATVKTHLHHLFQKTGTRRQVDLVKLVIASMHTSTDGD